MNYLRQIWTWNATVPEPTDICVHDLIARTTLQQPDAPAVCAWDGDWSYRDLDRLSTKLALHLIDLGVNPTTIVPLCFEKSKYTPVAALAVMKAGGASVALDPSQPEERLRSIIAQVEPVLVLASASMEELAKEVATTSAAVTVVDNVTLSELFTKSDEGKRLPIVKPSSRLYVVFTSGSTGTPKGVVITHSNYSSAIQYQQDSHGFKPRSRVYDFASYAFDVSWSNILHTLTIGACLCIPSDKDRRNNLVESIDSLRATHVDVTPSIARILPDSTIRSIETLVLGGERLPIEHAQHWSGLVNLKNPYGPSECTPTATITTIQPGEEFDGSIGKGLGLNTWVVDPEDADSLVPVGNTGELLLEGPLVGAGYLNDPIKTEAAFIDDPGFLLRGGDGPDQPGRRGRVYKTGDIVRYNPDGSLTFVGRKDTQVKINGQRVELGDVESHVRKHTPEDSVRTVVADMIRPNGSSTNVLVAFLEVDSPEAGNEEHELLAYTKSIIPGLNETLGAEVPSFMIPAIYIPLKAFPLSPTGKTDRRKLRAAGESMDLTELAALNATAAAGEKRPPQTPEEKCLQGLWCTVLGAEGSAIGLDDSFLQNGGDSITAMKLVGAARGQGLSLTVADIFKHPRLEDMAKVAKVATETDSPKNTAIRPFELLAGVDVEDDVAKIRDEAAKQCAVTAFQIEDVFPCTPLQEGLLSLSAKNEGAYTVQYVLELWPDVDFQRLVRAWQDVLSKTPILRTRIVSLVGQGLVQVVVEERSQLLPASETEFRNLNDVSSDKKGMGLGSPLAKFELVKHGENGEKRSFVWTMHHALYDGWSIRLMLEKLENSYNGGKTQQSPAFQGFIRYVQETNDAHVTSYWAGQFEGSEAQTFPMLPSPNYQPKSDHVYKHAVRELQWPTTGITASSAIRAAFSILVAAYTNEPDVVFGTTTTGRQAAVPGVEEMVAPTIATVPVRVAVNQQQSLGQFLQKVQSQSVEMTSFEQAGLHNIRRISANAEQACQFQTLLVVQPAEKTDEQSSGIFAKSAEDLNRGDSEGVAELGTYAMTLECHIEEHGVEVNVSFDPVVLGHEQIKRLAQQFEHVVRQLCSSELVDTALADIETVSEKDMLDIWTWNATVPESFDVCVHDLITETAVRQPEAPAVSAWDGDWSYAELDTLSTRLAYPLVSLGVANTVVPVCFEKSKWTPVAILAAMKAGAASVTMDISQPQDRLRSIVSQVNPRVILSSASRRELASELTRAINIVIDEASVPSLPLPREKLPAVDPSSKLYLVFTSGSTGTPKGVVISHKNYSSAIRHQQEAHGFQSTSRVYDFASYAFDVSWSNFLHTFTIGACLCIPSEADRRDNLAGSLERFGATHADMTPSAASVLPEESFSRLQTLVLGGEKLSVEYAQRWSKLVNLKNPYGPSECTPTATITTVTPNDEFMASIGKGLGLNTWVVDTVHGSCLVPIGSIGELLLEGPLVGAGYLGDTEKTAAAFVDDPEFLLQGGPKQGGRRGRLYKTGDLVRYNPDGSLSFIGRKDAQVKVNGQRVELSEIENHMSRHPETRQAAVLLPKSGPCSGRLVGFFSVKGINNDKKGTEEIQLINDNNSGLAGAHVEGLQSLLNDSLPAYMVPSIWVGLESIPLSTSGKLNHKTLQTWLVNMDAETFVKISPRGEGGDAAFREPQTEMERVIAEACSNVLNMPVATINLDRSFIANGGDSISAMRLNAQCSAAKLAFSVASLLKSKSLAEVAASSAVVSTSNVVTYEEKTEKPFTLSPIQQWFFQQAPYKKFADGYCNQGFYLKIKSKLMTQELEIAISRVVEQHSMLRARFQKVGDNWSQQVLNSNTNGVYHFRTANLATMTDVERVAHSRHQSLDIEEGPVFSADVCNLDSGEQYLLLIAHHLVVDLVSWRVILDDLETLLTGGKLQPSLPFQVWNQMQTKRGQTDPQLSPEHVLSTTGVRNDLDFWRFTPDMTNAVEDHVSHTVKVNKRVTNLMLKEANHALNTEPVELLLSAVWDSFLRSFPQRNDLTIFSEGHGRESWSPEIDLSRTVSWFTTISPIHVSRKEGANSTANLVRFVKDARRHLPANGWAYFTSRYLNDSGKKAFKSHDSIMEMTFNYHGQFQQLERDDSLFEDVTLNGVCEQGPALPASSLFSVEVSIGDGQTHFTVSANRYIAHQELIATWVAGIAQSLETICSQLAAASTSSSTLCDYEFLSLGYQALDQLQDQIIPEIESLNNSTVENIYPCLPTVDGILISQVKDPESYKTLQQFEITTQDSKPISLDNLEQAWQRVVAHQPSLRTVFIPGLDELAAFDQVILKQHHAEVIVLRAESGNETEAYEMLKRLPPVNYQKPTPPHRVTMCQLSSSRIICQVEISHAITDGASTSILARDLMKAYNGTLGSTNQMLTVEGFARAQKATPKSKKMTYWKNKLSGVEPCQFPKISNISTTNTNDAGSAVCKIENELFHGIQEFCNSHSITAASFLQTAWALTLTAYTGTDSPCFGYLASGRDLPIAGLDESIGAYTTMLVCRVDTKRPSPSHELIQVVHDQILHDLEYQHYSLAAIQHELDISPGQPLFNSIVSYQRQGEETPDDSHGLVIKTLDGEDLTEYDIVVNIGHGPKSIEIVLDYTRACLSDSQATRVLSLLQTISATLVKRPSNDYVTLDGLDMVSSEDMADIWRWNSGVPETVNACVHDMIDETTKKQPHAPAICAWDGEWTYSELDDLSTRFAHHLVGLGVGPEVAVPLCLEKSKWSPVAMMGVMKAGGASVALDGNQPEERLRTIINQIKPPVILSSAAHQELAGRLTNELAGLASVVTVDDANLATLRLPQSNQTLPTVKPSNKLYLVFTSGSTGVPKGVVVTHSNIASAIKYQRQALGFTPESRVFDFSSYMFDVVWCNLLQGLSAGGCVCIPSDQDKKTDFMAAITKLRANLVIFTPSAIRGLNLDVLNSLRSLHFIGEPLHMDTFKKVDPKVDVSNLYGPSECTTFSTVQAISGRNPQAITIGRGAGLNTWVVDTSTGTSLVPIGRTGELLLEGPLVASGYLGDPVKTAAAFVDDPPFLLRGGPGHPGRRGRCYKTGDIVRYNADGTLTFIGRKDAQVKINGQRVELTDIESHVQSALAGEYKNVQVIAEVVSPQQTSNSMLIAFICFGTTAFQDMSESERLEFTKKATAQLDGRLASQVPAYMIPSAYIPLESIPVTATGKTDRRRLRETAKELTWEQLTANNSSDTERRQPGTPLERQLQILWATVLGVEPNLIGADDSFLRVGGDSVGAMRLVGSAREIGYSLSVADILKNPKLCDMAKLLGEVPEPTQDTVDNFSLLKPDADVYEATKEAAAACGVEHSQIEDLYPCTSLQEGLLALTMKRPGDYIIRSILELRTSTNVGKFQWAWDKVLATTPILRSRIVDLTDQGLMQAVIRQNPQWTSADTSNLKAFVHADEQKTTGLGTSLVRFGMVHDNDRHYFVLTLHHAVYDGWALNLMFERLEKAYQGKLSEGLPDFRRFVTHVSRTDPEAATKFWNNQLRASEAQVFPALPSVTSEPKSDKSIIHQINNLHWSKNDITASTAVRAAVSVLIADYTDSQDVVYGVTSTGRQIAIPGVEQMVGPTIATVPIRVPVGNDKSLLQFLTQIQEQSIEVTSFEQTGLQRIRKLSADAERACNFQTLLIVQPADESAEWHSEIIARETNEEGEDGEYATQEFETYALTLECHLGDDRVHMKVNFDSSVIEEAQVKRLTQQLEHILRQICSSGSELKVSEIETASKEDVTDIWNWNSAVPETVNKCVHELISDTARRQPQAQAVCAWDGNWTYEELDRLSTKLAHYLVSLGVSSQHILPLLFEKSRWMPIAMLGAMKAGAASVAVDTNQPEDRLRSIITQANPIVTLSSVAKQDLSRTLTSAQNVLVNGDGLEAIPLPKGNKTLPAVDPSSRLYLVFTSGSTGTPKGVIIRHSNFASAIKHQKEAQGIVPTSRVYDFASYAFDVAWANPLLTFEVGACLCIPSDSDRKDDMNGSIARLRPTHADLTPSAALVLSNESLQQLHTLTLGGERLSADYAAKWSQFVTVKNSYGPSECTPTATFTDGISLDSPLGASIGRPLGLNTWVADAATGQSLVPIGSVGELLLEGPLVGAGYLGDSKKTAEAFIEDPAFLVRGGGPGQPGRRGRLYKTGDIVHYNSDGSIAFFCRKDAQVKINGQRVELSEIENHITRYNATRQVAVLLPSAGLCAKRLVGVISLEGLHGEINEADAADIHFVSSKHAKVANEHVEALQLFLHTSLPRYMVPSMWIVLNSLPMTASGKQNNKTLQNWLTGMDAETFAKVTNTETDVAVRSPETDIERVLCKVCSAILNIPTNEFNLGRSFIANGGDSISAMRLASQCRAANISFSVANLLQSKTIAEFAASCTTITTVAVKQEETFVTPFELSPIQRWFFEQLPFKSGDEREQFYNQGFYVKIRQSFPVDQIETAVSKLVDHHSMLRSRFHKVDGDWKQLVLKPGKGLHHFCSSTCRSMKQIQTLTQERHRMLSIENGPVFSADVCNLGQEQYLILIAHHLVVDLVSWRIILDDLEVLFNGGELEAGLPFQAWNKHQIERGASSQLKPDNVLSSENTHNDLDFWNYTSLISNNLADHETRFVDIDQQTTSLVLGNANVAMNTEPVELLLSAVWDAFLRVFPQRDGLTIFNEGHGREPWTEDIDLSRTVGWFTTLSPINVPRSAINNVANIVRFVKDARRRLPGNGWSYFASRYLNEEGKGRFQSHKTDTEVVFNYHGQFQQLESEEALFKDIDLEGVSEQGLKIPASTLFNIEVAIEAGQARFDFSFNRYIAHQRQIQQWIGQIAPSLKKICEDLVAATATRTLCDFEFVKPDYKGLDELLGRTIPEIEAINGSVVEDIYPCSPTVDGILLSQVKQPDSYKTVQLHEIVSPNGNTVNLVALSEAWQKVVFHQPALRSLFIGGLDKTSAFSQAILKQHTGEVVLLQAASQKEALDQFKKLPAANYQQQKPPHRLALCQTSDKKVFCQIEMSHAITDGASTGILAQDLANAYAADLSTTDLTKTTRDFTAALISKPHSEKISFWKNKLDGLESCKFPYLLGVPHEVGAPSTEISIVLENEVFNQIQEFCGSNQITLASFLKSAWALTLSAYVEANSVCFGYLASGRDLPIAGLEESVGAYTNIMVCRADIDRQAAGSEFVRQIHKQLMQDLSFQHTSLASIQHELGLCSGQQLFNSIVSFQKVDDSAEGEDDGKLLFKGIDGEDPTEYDIVLGINQGSRSIEIDFDYAPSCLTDEQAARVLSHMKSNILALLREKPSSLLSNEDKRDIWKWNAKVPETADVCVHDLITKTALRQPKAPAISAWDGNFTYGELTNMSARLACRLIELGVGSDTIVPICFEKSKWTPIAMLAVMKAGGASVTMDTSQPEERLQSIITQATPKIVLCSAEKRQLAGKLTTSTILTIDDGSIASMTDKTQLPNVSPSSRLYIVFTSGSTGTPKGVVITHSNYSSAIKHQQHAHGFKATSRVFDFASYAFDVSWSNFLHTLTIGACLCIPSDADRKNDPAGAIDRLRCTHADMTPSAASVLPAETFLKLDTVVLGGEKLSPEYAHHWSTLTSVRNPYGPCECTPTATIVEVDPAEAAKGSVTIGNGIGLNTWIVDPVTGDSLVPIGIAGELLLEGPLVGAGYLGDSVKTAAAFIEDPRFLLEGGGPNSPGRRGRLYKTGDLVKYNADGTLAFLGRKDAQVKINGQRVELEDIESHVASCLTSSDGAQVVADVITPQGSTNNMLVAFLNPKDPAIQKLNKQELITYTKRATVGLEEKLGAQIPPYMIPSAYITLAAFPMTATGKTDRRRLRDMGNALTWEQLAATNSSQQESRQPHTPMEIQLLKLWASVLNISAERISANDSFLRIGGDSIGAMRLVGAARENGLALSVMDVLKSPKLSEMAKLLHPLAGQQVAEPPVYKPFTLIPKAHNKTSVFDRLSDLGVGVQDVEDILPVTDQQARCIAMTHTASRNLLLYHTLDGSGTPRIRRMHAVCAELVNRFDQLRTLFVAHKGVFLQVVLKSLDLDIPIFKTQDASLEQFTETLRLRDMREELRYGKSLTKISIIHQTREDKYRVVVRVSHAQHDGMSLMKMWNAFEEMYNDGEGSVSLMNTRTEDMAKASFSNYMHSISCMDKEAAQSYWRKLLRDSNMTYLKPRSSPTLTFGEGPCITRNIPQTVTQGTDFTFSTVLKAAWAYVLAKHTASDDVVFSNLTHGRGLPGTQDVFGACVNIIPTRVSFADVLTARDLVSMVNNQQISTMQYENLGTREIVRECTNWPKWTYAGSVVYHHNFDDGDYKAHEPSMHVEETVGLSEGDVDNTDVHITSKPNGDNFSVELSFAADVVSQREAEILGAKLIETIILFCRFMDMPLSLPSEILSLAAPLPSPQKAVRAAPTEQQLIFSNIIPTAVEAALDNAWADVFGRRLTSANKARETFFDLGGDLVDASLLSAHMEQQGYKLTIEDILKNPTWYSQLALLSKRVAVDTGFRFIGSFLKKFPCFGF